MEREVFGPVPFEKIREWADSSQINPQDTLSIDQLIWTKAPMVPEMEMDWLIVVGENIVYGPTTAESLLEFESLARLTDDRVNQLPHRQTASVGRNAILSKLFCGGLTARQAPARVPPAQ